MKLLLDTHTFLWMSLDDPQLSETARERLSDTANELYLSPASYWEIAIKISIGKYMLSEPLADVVKREVVANDLKLLAINVDHAAELSMLPFHHKDPFDRMIIAQALTGDLELISSDAIAEDYGLSVIW